MHVSLSCYKTDNYSSLSSMTCDVQQRVCNAERLPRSLDLVGFKKNSVLSSVVDSIVRDLIDFRRILLISTQRATMVQNAHQMAVILTRALTHTTMSVSFAQAMREKRPIPLLLFFRTLIEFCGCSEQYMRRSRWQAPRVCPALVARP